MVHMATQKTPADDQSNHPVSNHVTRRRAVGLMAAVVAGGGGVALATGDAAGAEVSVEELTVDDASFEAEQVDPVADAEVAYAYRYDTPNAVLLTLDVDGEPIAEADLSTSTAEAEGTETLSGRVVDAPAYDLSAFATEVGETITREVTFGVGISVQVNGEEVASDRATETATIEVTNPDDGDPYARIGGEITIRDGS
jgi:hypothetical protein